MRVQSLDWEDPLEKESQPTVVFLPGKFRGQRSLVCYNPGGLKVVNQYSATDHTHTHTHTYPSLTVGIYLFSSVAESCPTFCDPMNSNMPGFPVHQELLELIQTHVH